MTNFKNQEITKSNEITKDVLKDLTRKELSNLSKNIEKMKISSFDDILKNYKIYLTPEDKTYITGLKNTFNADIAKSQKDLNSLYKIMLNIEKKIKCKPKTDPTVVEQLKIDIATLYFSKLSSSFIGLEILFEEGGLGISTTVEQYMFQNNIKINYGTPEKLICDDTELNTIYKQRQTEGDETFLAQRVETYAKKNGITLTNKINKSLDYTYYYIGLVEYIKDVTAKGYGKKQIEKSISFITEYANFMGDLTTHTNEEYDKYEMQLIYSYDEFVNKARVNPGLESLETGLSIEELETYDDIELGVGLINKYQTGGEKFLANLKENNLTHLQEILKYYDDHPHEVTVSRCNVRSYVAYCGNKNNGQPNLDLWKAIITQDTRINDDYPDFANIYLEYSKIK